jgi:hypothetical protein
VVKFGGGYSISAYWWLNLLVVILLVPIGGYFIGGYFISAYWWLFY